MQRRPAFTPEQRDRDLVEQDPVLRAGARAAVADERAEASPAQTSAGSLPSAARKAATESKCGAAPGSASARARMAARRRAWTGAVVMSCAAIPGDEHVEFARQLRVEPHRDAIEHVDRLAEAVEAEQRLAQRERAAGLLPARRRGGERCLEMRHRVALPRVPLREPEQQQQVRAQLGRGRLREHAAQQHGGGLGGARGLRRGRRRGQALHHPRVARGLRREQVLREAAARHVGQQLGRAPVRAPAGRGGDRVQDRRAHHRMDEGERPAGSQEPSAGEHVGGRARGLAVQPGQRGGGGGGGLLEHGDRVRERDRVGGQPAEPRADPRADPADAERAHAGRRVVARRHTLLPQPCGELVQQERNPARRIDAGRDEGRLRRCAEAELEDPRGRHGAERRRPDALHGRILGERGELLGRRAGLGPPRGDDERDGQLLDPRAQEVEEPQRARVGPVGVVDDEAERPAAARFAVSQ